MLDQQTGVSKRICFFFLLCAVLPEQGQNLGMPQWLDFF